MLWMVPDAIAGTAPCWGIPCWAWAVFTSFERSPVVGPRIVCSLWTFPCKIATYPSSRNTWDCEPGTLRDRDGNDREGSDEFVGCGVVRSTQTCRGIQPLTRQPVEQCRGNEECCPDEYPHRTQDLTAVHAHEEKVQWVRAHEDSPGALLMSSSDDTSGRDGTLKHASAWS